MNEMIVTHATCVACGCLSDDIELHVDRQRLRRASRACKLGRASFFGHAAACPRPTALVDGRPATVQAAVEAAAGILVRADLPLVFGLGNSTSESQRAAIMLAEEIGGIVDSHTSLTHGPSKIAAQQ